jgi:hypothetical protein
VLRIGKAIAGTGSEFVIHALKLGLSDTLKHSVNQTVVRKTARLLTKTLTVSLTESITRLFLYVHAQPHDLP